ncbi:hypothetical protein, partial [Escherichia coli]|uniref:hypothetical protein n=1 Tax=Escherichia coli TaxID=562 RepID=UPI001F1EAE08
LPILIVTGGDGVTGQWVLVPIHGIPLVARARCAGTGRRGIGCRNAGRAARRRALALDPAGSPFR